MADEGVKSWISPVDEVQLLRAAACDWRLSRGDIGVYAVILKGADRDWLSFPGTRLIAEKARLAASNVGTSIEKLERLGYLKVIRRGQRKRQDYQLLQSPKLAESAPARKSSGFGNSAPARKSRDERASAPVDRCSSAPVDRKDLLLCIGAEGTLEDALEVTRAESTHAKPAATPLPTWLPVESWEAWKDHRGKKFSTKAQGLALRKLEALRAEGHDPAKLIDLAIESDWVSFYPRESTKAAGNAVGMVERDPRTDAEIEAANEAELARFNFGAAA